MTAPDTLRELLARATKAPWFVAGVRVKLDRQDTHAICKYDEDAKRDINIANVWYDPKTGTGRTDAELIALAPTLAAQRIEDAATIARLTEERDAVVKANGLLMVRIKSLDKALGQATHGGWQE